MLVSNTFTDMIKASLLFMPYKCVFQKFRECDAADRIPYCYGTSNFLIEEPAFRSCTRLRFHERFLAALLCAALPEMRWFKWTSVCCYFCSAAVSRGTSVSPRLAAAVLCHAAGWRPMGRGTSVPLVETALPVFSSWKRSLNSWSCDLKQLIVAEPLKKFFAYFVTRRFSTVTTRTCLCCRS
jgi:hypothetical protein